MSAYPPPPVCDAFRRADGQPLIVAEIGVNHEGDFDVVKFQTYKAGKLASKNSPSYWDLNSEPTTSQFELFQKYDGFGDSEYQALAAYAGSVGVGFASTPFDLEAVALLAPLMPFFKIASADITNFPLLEACAKHGKPMLLSTGASTIAEVDEAARFVRQWLPPEQICLLHCVLRYPTPNEDAHLGAIGHLRTIFPEHPIGYSDHTRPDPGMLVLLRSWMLGAVVIEKHFTHDKTLPGNDHYHAMDHEDLARFRAGASLLQTVEGSPFKHVLDGEQIARKNARRSLVAARDLAAGEVLKRQDLAVKRPAFGLPTKALDEVIGRPLSKDLAEDDFLTWDHLLG